MKQYIKKRDKGDRTHLKFYEKVFIRELFAKGWETPAIQEMLYNSFQAYFSENCIRAVKGFEIDLPKLTYEERRQYDEAKVKIDLIASTTVSGFQNEIKRLQNIRKKAEMILGSRVDSGDVSDETLTKIAKDFYERERLMAGMPTQITKDLSSMTDDEIIKEAYEIDPTSMEKLLSEFRNKPNGDTESVVAGIEAPQEGGEDKILETAPETTAVHNE